MDFNMKKPKYPKIYRKVTPEMDRMIHEMYGNGWMQADIARHFKLSSATITKRLHERSRQISLASSRKWTKIYRQDPAYVEKVNESVRKNVNKRYHNDKKYNKFLKNYSYYDKRNRREYLRDYNRKRYLKQKLELLKRNSMPEHKRYSTTAQKNNKKGVF